MKSQNFKRKGRKSFTQRTQINTYMDTFVKFKHYFLIVIFFVFSLCSIYAQEEKTSNKTSKSGHKKEIFAFGPKLSINFANERMCSEEYMAGADLGLFFRISPGRLYFQPEINYQIRNVLERKDLWNIHNISKYRSHHIDVPVLIGVKVVNLRLLKFRVFAGPELCFRLKDQLSRKNFQLGFQAGLGFDIWRFTIDASYSFLGYIQPRISTTHSNIFKLGLGFKCF